MTTYPAIGGIPEVESLLTSLERVKEFLQIAETDDKLLGNLVVAVSGEIEAYLGRSINQATVTDERLDSPGKHYLLLSYAPIVSITTVEENDVSLVEDTDFECKAQDKLIGHLIRISGGSVTDWASGVRVVTVTYVHGYATVPYAIVQAATELVAFDYLQSPSSGQGRFGLDGKVLEAGGVSRYMTREALWEVQKPRLSVYRRASA